MARRLYLRVIQRRAADLELTKVLNTLFRNAEANRFATAIFQAANRVRLKKDAALIDQAGTQDEIYKRDLEQDPTVGLAALTASLENLGAVASSPAMAKAGAAISSLASTLQSIAAYGQEHPNAAMAAGGVVAAGALGGAGYLSYQFLNGFGLKTSAGLLDGAAANLTAAADRLGMKGSMPGSPGGGGGSKDAPGLGWRGLFTALNFGSFAWNAASNANVKYDKQGQPYMDALWGKQVQALNDWYEKPIPSWKDIGQALKHQLPSLGGAPQQPPPNQGAGHWQYYGKGGRKWVDDVQQGADKAKGAVESLNTTVAPKVDTSSLEAAKAAAAALLATLNQIAGAASAASSAASGIKLPNIGAVKRSSFSPSGDMDR